MGQPTLESLLDEFDELFDYYVDVAKAKERKQETFAKSMHIANEKTGETFQLQHSIQKKLLEQHAVLKQKIGYINYLATQKRGLTDVFFMTITAPSQCHPFKTLNGEVTMNPNFGYPDIKTATAEAYRLIEETYRVFYKALKQRLRDSGIDTEMLFAKVYEWHKSSYIPHLHAIIYLPPDVMVRPKRRNGREIPLRVWAKKKFYEILSRQDFNYSQHPKRKSNDFKTAKEDGRSISGYLMKYIEKTLDAAKTDEFGQNTMAYFLYGWKTSNKIRQHSTSRLPLNSVEYKKLYYSLHKDERDELLESAKTNKTNIMVELSKVTDVTRTLYEQEVFYEKRLDAQNGISAVKVYEGELTPVKTVKPLQHDSARYSIHTVKHQTKKRFMLNFTNRQKKKGLQNIKARILDVLGKAYAKLSSLFHAKHQRQLIEWQKIYRHYETRSQAYTITQEPVITEITVNAGGSKRYSKSDFYVI